tara:strand:+ start:4308 stop:4433 length:126 start_codon:yes stop_codon:yes gene_type:complete
MYFAWLFREIRRFLVKPMGAAAERAGQAFDPAMLGSFRTGK